MARNGSGTMSVTNTFTPSTTISSTNVNANFSDIATEITNSVAADGQTTMTGVLKHANGSDSAPSITFGTDTNTGIYREGADSIGFTLGGVPGINIGTGGTNILKDFVVNTSKFVVFAATGNTSVAGTLDVTGNVAVNTNKFTVAASSGNTVVAGTLGVTGATSLTSDLAVNTNKFTVAASSGNTVVAGTLNVTGVATLTGGVAGLIAAQSDQETGTSTTLAVSPGRQHFHPGHPKFVAYATVSAGTPTLQTPPSYNITSITDAGVGSLTVTIATDFSSANWAPLVMTDKSGTLADSSFYDTPASGGSVALSNVNTNVSGVDPTSWSVIGFGDHA